MVLKEIIPSSWDVPGVFRDRVGSTVGRQRAMFAEGHLLLLLHKPPAASDSRREGRVFWREPAGVWKSDSMGEGVDALRQHVEEFAGLLDELDLKQEQADGVDEYFAVLDEEVAIKRITRNLHGALQQARELVPGDKDIINLRDRAGEVERAAEVLCGEARSGLDFALARHSEEQARSSAHMAQSAHRLNMLAALFFPIMTLSAIFGMNIRHGLETSRPPGIFFLVLLAGLFAGYILVQTLALRKLAANGKEPARVAARPGKTRDKAAERKQVRQMRRV